MDREFPKIVGHSNLKKQLEQFYKKVRVFALKCEVVVEVFCVIICAYSLSFA